MRAPSCASRRARPRPIPLLPPVTSATRLRSDIYLPGKISWKDFQYSPADAEVLPEPGNNDRHIVGLFRSPGPLFGRRHERLRDHERRGTLQALRRFLQTAERLRSEEHTSELQSQSNLVCRLLLEKKMTSPSACYTASSRTSSLP